MKQIPSSYFICYHVALDFLYKTFQNVSQTTDSSDCKNHMNFKKFNETQINNAILCMSNCVDVAGAKSKKLAQQLAQTNIIMDLLYLTRDGHKMDMQKNCGILIAKLCKTDEK